MDTYDGIPTIYEGDVQYPYADVGAPNLLHISKVTPENRKSYTYECPCCHKRLRPRLGQKNRHCFYHDAGSRCAMDKYIHDTAERLLKEKFDRDEPFEIEMSVTKQCKNFDDCKFATDKGSHPCMTRDLKKYDLKEHYQECYVEKAYGDFRPDLMLVDNTGKHNPIFIEIWHKHKSDDLKLKSENQIIEIRLKKVDELQPLVENPIAESDTVKFYNFKQAKFNPDESTARKFYKFVLYPSMKTWCTPTPQIICTEYQKHYKGNPLVEITSDLMGYYKVNDFWQHCIHICRQRGYDVKDCYMCKHCRYNREAEEGEEDTIYCKKLTTPETKHICKHDFGRTCEAFEEREDESFRLKIRFYNNVLDIWEAKSKTDYQSRATKENV